MAENTAHGEYRPAVTIGVPVYNGERYLAGALDMLLAQSYRDFEIVICDNASDDATSEIARRYAAGDARVRYVRYDRTVSPVASFCRAVANARAELFTWAAVDDGRPLDAIAACVAALERDPAAVMAHGPVIADVVRQGRSITIEHDIDLSSAEIAERVRRYATDVQYNAMLYGLYRRGHLQKAVFRQHPGHDYLLPLQMCSRGPIAYTRTPMLVYRHVWGETDTPMYRLERLTLRDLLVYRGVRRHKCWITLLLGTGYLLTQSGVPLRDRLKASVVHATAFGRRFKRHLAAELVFLAFTPAAWIVSPFIPTGRRLKHMLARGLMPR